MSGPAGGRRPQKVRPKPVKGTHRLDKAAGGFRHRTRQRCACAVLSHRKTQRVALHVKATIRRGVYLEGPAPVRLLKGLLEAVKR